MEETAAAVAENPARGRKGASPRRFVIDSLLLLKFYHYVCGPAGPLRRWGADGGEFLEVFHYAAGMRVDPRTFVITHLAPVEFARQSAVGVRVMDSSNIEVLAALDELGLPLVAHFHSHPGRGPDANHPSSIDQRFQERLERGGHIAIGGIFSRGRQDSMGHVRFFAGEAGRFNVEVVGNNVSMDGDNAFTLSLADSQLSMQTVACR